MKRHEESGIALITTLIMLSLVTFLSVAFLTLTRQERAVVQVQTEVTKAEEMEHTAFDRAVGEVMTRMLGSNGPNARMIYDFIVSTNYERKGPFLPGVSSLANVSYTNALGGPLTRAEQLQNLNHLFYDPRVPVYRDVNLDGRIDPREYGREFIYYIDFNENGQFEPSGLVQNTNYLGQMEGGQGYRMGDPHWIGILDRPNTWHKGDNRFVGRYAFLVQPTSRSLDLNYIHNQARLLGVPNPNYANEGFVRNQGVGNWEMNLAGFLASLNPEAWNRPAFPYNYTPFLPTSGSEAFDHARLLSRNRYEFQVPNIYEFRTLWTYTNQFPVSPPPGNVLFPGHRYFWNTADRYDLYGNGPINIGPSLQLGLTAPAGSFVTGDDLPLLTGTPALVDDSSPWFGSPVPNPFFTVQELLKDYGNPIPLYEPFANRLREHMRVTRIRNGMVIANDHANRYTFYRMLAQMGLDSAEPHTNKIHLNYLNWFAGDSTDYTRALHNPATFFEPWTRTNLLNPLDPPRTNYFFGFVADTLLKKRFGLSFKDHRVNNQSLRSTRAIPVWDSAANRNMYRSDWHQTLQLAANIYDATTGANHREWNGVTGYTAGQRVLFAGLAYEAVAAVPAGGTPPHQNVSWELRPHTPTVFRPRFDVITNAMDEVVRVQVTNYVHEVGTNYLTNLWLDMNIPAHRIALRDRLRANPVNGPNVNIYGVPMVVGAKKGLPNFNEFGLLSRITVSRGLEFERTAPTARTFRTNEMFNLAAVDRFTAEAWNSYTQAYPNGVQIHFRHAVHGQITNSYGTVLTNFGITNLPITYNLNPGNWRGNVYIPLSTRINQLLNEVRYNRATTNFSPIGDLPGNLVHEAASPNRFDVPDWHFVANHRLAFWIIDTNLNQVLDVVSLNDMTTYFDLTSKLLENDDLGIWNTNRQNGTNDMRWPTLGALRQLQISTNGTGISGDEWRGFDDGPPTPAEQAVTFRNWLHSENPQPDWAPKLNAPYPAIRSLLSRTSWSANDPLVHYTREDLTDFNRGLETEVITPPQAPANIDPNDSIIGLNRRYNPWGGKREPGEVIRTTGTNDIASNPEYYAYNLGLKDPGVRWSDDWNFPTHKLGTVGWLGRIHRGTPWQTVYLKAHMVPIVPPNGIEDYSWTRWAGRNNTHPTNDWELMDLFTTMPSPTAARGLLSINQDNDAAWYAALSGLLMLTNVVDDLTIGPTNANSLGWLALSPNNNEIQRIINGIRRVRNAQPNGMFTNLGQLLSVQELSAGGTNVNNPVSPTNFSPVLNAGVRIDEYFSPQEEHGIPDSAYERLPQQLMSLLKVEDHPRLTVYAWGQSLKPARRSVVLTAGPLRGLCTNYQVTAEVGSKSVVRLEGVNPVFGIGANNFRSLYEIQNNPSPPGTPNYDLLGQDRIRIGRIAFRLRHSQRMMGRIDGTPVRFYPDPTTPAPVPPNRLPSYDPDRGGPLLPVRLEPGRTYYIVNSRADDFQISLRPDGPPLDLVDIGVGVHRVTTVPKAVVESHNLLYPE